MDKKKFPSKKEARHLIENKIASALADLKTVLGDEEFASRIKKAAKVFAKGFKAEAKKVKAPIVPKAKAIAPAKVEAPKPKAVPKKAVKKAAKKK